MSTEAAPTPIPADRIEAEWRALSLDLLRLVLRAANLANYSRLQAKAQEKTP